MRNTVIAIVGALTLAIPHAAMAQSDMEMARDVYPILVECTIVTGVSDQYGYRARHSMDEWIELIAPTAAMIGAKSDDDLEAAADALLARGEQDGADATQAYIVDRAEYCDTILDSI